MKRIVASTLVLFIIISFAGCGSDKDKIVGKWNVDGRDCEFKFAKDETGSLSIDGTTIDFTWSISDGMLKLTQEYPYSSTWFQYEFTGSMLVLSYSGEQIILKRT